MQSTTEYPENGKAPLEPKVFQPLSGPERVLGPFLCAALLRGHPMMGLRHVLDRLEGTVWHHVARALVNANGSGADRLASSVRDICLEDMGTTETRYMILGAIEDVTESVEQWLRNDPQYIMRAKIRRTRYAEVADLYKDTTWLWGGWVPRGYLSMVCGRPGIGKSVLMAWLATIALKGGHYPNGDEMKIPECYGSDIEHARGECGCPCVMWIDTEGTQPLLIQRFKELGTPMGRVFYPPGDDPSDTEFPNVDLSLEKWRNKITGLAIDERPVWIIIDSLRGAHTGKERDDTHMQSVLAWAAGLTRDLGTALTFTHHLRKTQPGEPADISLDSIRGSSAIAAMMRSIIALDKPDPRADSLRLAVIKSNLVRIPSPCGVVLAENGTPQTAAKAPEPQRNETLTDRGMSFLEARLAQGPRTVDELFYEAEQIGISKATLRVAKDRLGVVAVSRNKDNNKWRWALRAVPEQSPPGDDKKRPF